jgi:hypothetical protein
MSRLADQERQELEDMRDSIVTRIEELQTQTDHGTLTDEKRYKQLEEEFGFEYLETLTKINSLLYSKQSSHSVMPRTLLASILGLFLLGFTISAFFTFSPTGFTVLGTETVLEANQLIVSQQSQQLELPQQTVITTLTLSKPTTLILEDAKRTLTLYENGRCIGCGQHIYAPYTVTNTGKIDTTIQELRIIE